MGAKSKYSLNFSASRVAEEMSSLRSGLKQGERRSRVGWDAEQGTRESSVSVGTLEASALPCSHWAIASPASPPEARTVLDQAKQLTS